MTPRPWRVTGRRRETADSWTLDLEPADDGAPMSFLPGQFNMIYAFGIGEAPISISGDPGADRPLVHTVRDVGAVSAAICRAAPGEVLGVRGPYGSAWPVAALGGRHVLIVAGGVGLAPLRPALRAALERRRELAGLTLLLGGRTPADLLFRDELEELGADPRLELAISVDSAGSGWRGHVGVVTTLIDDLDLDPARATALLCGPEVMMRFAAQALIGRGMDRGDIYLSMERNMKCAVTQCGRCQLGPAFVCREGAVMRYCDIERVLGLREV
ncbi:MAG: Ni/Fe hydrogenase subunit gamma [Acidobacteria bacterium]|nr:MAG: Ni/Fe hydrogenase subunit gamma [Acidobacteriota bacterium]MCL4286097.1 FAD/NAD(P)-binding protein [Thermoleophilia bacterium]GIK78413.1 MAG: oxidoreductase [Actinomycetes bacterium]